MNDTDTTIIGEKLDKLSLSTQPLSRAERNLIWSELSPKLVRRSPRTAREANLLTVVKFLIGTLILGAGSVATISYADSSLPGDALFPVDRAIEQVRITLARDEDKVTLERKFTAERISEAKVILREAALVFPRASTSAEVVMSSEHRDERAIETEKQVEAAITILRIYASSTPFEDERQPLQDAIDAMAKIAAPTETDMPPAVTRTEMKQDELRVETRSDDGRVKIEVKNGEIKTELKSASGEVKTETKIETSGKGGEGKAVTTSASTSSGVITLPFSIVPVIGGVSASSSASTTSATSASEGASNSGSPATSSGTGTSGSTSGATGTSGGSGSTSGGGGDTTGNTSSSGGSSSTGGSPAPAPTPPPPPASVTLTKAEAKVGSSSTEVKLEFGQVKEQFYTSAATSGAIVTEIVTRHPELSVSLVSTLLVVTH